MHSEAAKPAPSVIAWWWTRIDNAVAVFQARLTCVRRRARIVIGSRAASLEPQAEDEHETREQHPKRYSRQDPDVLSSANAQSDAHRRRQDRDPEEDGGAHLNLPCRPKDRFASAGRADTALLPTSLMVSRQAAVADDALLRDDVIVAEGATVRRDVNVVSLDWLRIRLAPRLLLEFHVLNPHPACGPSGLIPV
jgi:hypothetical protein